VNPFPNGSTKNIPHVAAGVRRLKTEIRSSKGKETVKSAVWGSLRFPRFGGHVMKGIGK